MSLLEKLDRPKGLILFLLICFLQAVVEGSLSRVRQISLANVAQK